VGCSKVDILSEYLLIYSNCDIFCWIPSESLYFPDLAKFQQSSKCGISSRVFATHTAFLYFSRSESILSFPGPFVESGKPCILLVFIFGAHVPPSRHSP